MSKVIVNGRSSDRVASFLPNYWLIHNHRGTANIVFQITLKRGKGHMVMDIYGSRNGVVNVLKYPDG